MYPLYGAPTDAQVQQVLSAAPGRSANLDPRIEGWAQAVLGQATAEDVLAYIAALLNAPSYTAMFEGGLAVERPRVPFTEDPSLAREAVSLGRAVVDAWLLRGQLLPEVRWDTTGVTAPTFGEAEWITPDRLTIAGRYLRGVTSETWEYEVSGYPILPRYCRDRRDRSTSAAAMAELRRVANSVRTLVDGGLAHDDLLTRVLGSALLAW